MKRILLPICAMLLCMTACKKDNNGILRIETERYNSDAKLHLDDARYAVWDNQDMVKLNGTDYNVIVSGNSATISGVHTSNAYQAIYPAKWVTASNTITYPATQTYRENSDGDQVIDAPMGAYAQADENDGSAVLKFHNLGSILAVNVTGVSRVWKIEVTSATSNNINGDYDFYNASKKDPTPYIKAKLSTSNHGTTTTTLICDGVNIPTEGKTFYIAMPPINSAQLTIKVYDDSYCYSLSQVSTHTLEANHGYYAPFNAAECISNRVQYAPLPNQIWYTANLQISNTFLSGATQTFSDGHYVATFSSTITSIPVDAFQYQSVTSVSLPASVTALGTHSFQNCNSLTSISMPGVTVIGSGSFDMCHIDSLYLPKVVTLEVGSFYSTYLRAVYLPKVRTIMNSAFRQCSRLAHIYCNQTEAPSIAEGETDPEYFNEFEYVPTTAVLHLPYGCNTRWDANGSTIIQSWPGQYAYDL